MSDKEIDWSKKRLGFVIATIVLFLLGTYLYFNVQRSDSDIHPEDLIRIDSLIISVKPSFQEVKGKNPRKWIEFNCVGYEKRFEIEGFDYACVNDSAIINDLKIGSTIFVKILATDAQNIRTETFTSNSNYIHSLVYNDKEYLSLDCRNNAAKNDNKFGYYLFFIMIPFTLTFALFKSKPKIFGLSIDPILAVCIAGVLIMLILRHDVFS